MKPIRVECYAGYREAQRPQRFTMGDHTYEVREVEDQWYSPEAIFFRVLADDGNLYLLRHDETGDLWSLEGLRAQR